MKTAVLFLCLLLSSTIFAQASWQSSLDGDIRYYNTTDFGIVLAGTDKSLYALDGKTGERLWRRATGRVNETAVTPVPGTDLVLFSRDLGDRSRLEAVDVLTGSTVWQSEKVKGDIMQLALDPESDLLAAVLVMKARGNSGETLKRKPSIHMLRLSSGDEVWKRSLDGDLEMMPVRFSESGSVDHTLDNYRAPLLVDGRLWLFYDGVTSYDARTGKDKLREKFKVNESGLALTEADPVIDDRYLFVSGRGRVRAIDRRTGEQAWKADDVGNAAEMVLVGDILYVRTGGRFMRLKDGETDEKGPFGVSALNASTGKTLWRYKGADKGLTNFAFADASTIVIADRDDLIALDAASGKRIAKHSHKIDKAQFVLVNEGGKAVVGGRNEIAAFDPRGTEVWRARHTAPGRGVLRTVAGIALRAAAIYFRYGGLATSALGLARGGLSIANSARSFRVSGLRSHLGNIDLSTIASDAARSAVTSRLYVYGSLAGQGSSFGRYSGMSITPGRLAGRPAPSRSGVEESIFDRIDPARRIDRLGDLLLRRKRLAELRVNTMYFYTELARGGRGLMGVNVHTGQDERAIRVGDPDTRFVVDDDLRLLYSADGKSLRAFAIDLR